MNWKEQAKEVIANQLSVDAAKLTDDFDFVRDGQADSLDLVEIIMDLEEELDINIPDDVAERVRTMGDAMRGLEPLMIETQSQHASAAGAGEGESDAL